MTCGQGAIRAAGVGVEACKSSLVTLWSSWKTPKIQRRGRLGQGAIIAVGQVGWKVKGMLFITGNPVALMHNPNG